MTEKSTGEQLAEGEALAHREGLPIGWKAEESKSAMIPNVRPLYAEMIQLIKRGRIDGIICWHVNRLIRNMEEGGILVQLLVDGKLREIRTPHAVYRTKDSILPIVIEAASATQQSIDQKHIVKRSMGGNFRNGGWNHKAPSGYVNVRDRLNSKRGHVVSDRKRYAIIAKAWHLMLTGTVTETEVWRLLKDEWGYRFRETLHGAVRPMSYGAVRDMFRNPFYAGYVRENGELLKGRHKAMVTVDEFQQVQRILARRSFSAKRVHHHAYTGFLVCKHCGQQVTAECKRLRNGTTWEVYHCSDSYNRCTQRGMSLARVDESLTNLIKSVQVDPDVLKIAANDLRRGLTVRRGAFSARLEQQRQALQVVSEKLNRLTTMWVSGLLTDPDRFKKMETEMLVEKEQLELAVKGCSSEGETMLQKVDRIMGYVLTISTGIEGGPSHRKRNIAKALGTFTFDGHEKKIELQLRPILREFLSYVKRFSGPLEPPKSSSEKQNGVAFDKPLHSGGGKSSGIELPDSLVLALQEDDVPLIADYVDSKPCLEDELE